MNRFKQIAEMLALTNEQAARKYMDKAWLRGQIEQAARDAEADWEKRLKAVK
jgi:hypothetical protein